MDTFSHPIFRIFEAAEDPETGRSSILACRVSLLGIILMIWESIPP